MRILILWLLCVVMPGSAYSQAASQPGSPSCAGIMDLRRITICVLEASPEYRSEQLKLKEISGRKLVASYLFPSNPVASAYLAHRKGTPSEGGPLGTGPAPVATNYQTLVTQEIYVGGKREKAQQVADEEYKVQAGRLEAVRRNMLSRTISSALRYSGFKREFDGTKQLYEVAKDLRDLSAARANEGVAPAMDVDVARAEELRLWKLLKQAERKMDSAKGELLILLNLNPDANLELEITGIALKELPNDIVSLVKIALANRPEIGVSEGEIILAARRLEQTKLQRIPNLTIGGFIQSDGFNEKVAGAQVSLPLTLWRTYEGEIRSASSVKEQAQENARLQERNVRLEIVHAVSSYLALRTEIEQYDASYLRDLDKDLDLLREALRTGRIKVVDALNSQRILTGAKLNFILSRTEYALAQVELVRAIGLSFEDNIQEIK
ncbi:outer membrane efflux protein [Leptospira fainei serovar Hurstbridge str. BUT 6]|uniref:Outer membrane efflux protein n=1 Tax=Leptospira fainei serovar Hurstbridge str. BUT 6 TaxID=1193011 RepID=S3W494_9LEPT|nr:TolC family protein [Leptospira fainei]EPG75102.1 outer membrane efflux protein [Leptospira fainei serovar Hurstbridge str. BUT 6]